MKKHIRYILLLFSFIAGCKKYEDGPWLSLRTKETRITGRWEFEYYEVDGVDSTSFFKSAYSTIPTYILSHKVRDEAEAAGNTSYGNWFFSDHHNILTIRLDDPLPGTIVIGPYQTLEVSWEILRLTNKELWLKTDYNQKAYVSHLKKTEER